MIVKLEAVNALAQLIAAIGVIVSLFYLAAQIRQNTRSMRAMGLDSLAHSLVDLLGPHAQNPESLRAFSVVTENWNAASDEERARTLPFIFATFKLFENAWPQQRQSTLDRQQWDGWDAYIRVYYHRPGVNTWWTMRRAAFAAGFREYLKKTQPVGSATHKSADPRWIFFTREGAHLNTPIAEPRRETLKEEHGVLISRAGLSSLRRRDQPHGTSLH